MDIEPPLPDDWEQGEVEANGIRLHYTRTGGDGPPLVVSHGVYDDGLCRAPLAREFADEYDVVLYDARGHGRSDAPETGYGADDRAADLMGLIEALDLDDPILFGHSMGGDTVTVAAASHPDVPRAVVLVDPAGMLGTPATPEERIAEVRETIQTWADHTAAELLDVDDGISAIAEADEELAARIAASRKRLDPAIVGVFEAGWVDPAERFLDVTAPTLILRADSASEVRERDHEYADLLPEGRIVHVDGASHVVFRDERERATEALRAFLADL